MAAMGCHLSNNLKVASCCLFIYLKINGGDTMSSLKIFFKLATAAFIAQAIVACSEDGSSSLDFSGDESSSSVESLSEIASSSSVEESSSSVESGNSLEPASSSSSEEYVLVDERDGQVYRIVDIGEQTWMAQNLNYTDTAKDYSYDYTPEIADSAIGRFYWDQDAKISCPKGWHLPRFMDFSKLVTTVGGPDSAGKLLRSTDAWYDRVGDTDIYGFSAVPTGMKCTGSSNTKAIYMSADYAQYGSLYSFNLQAEKPVEWKDNSAACYMAVRCVKDDEFYAVIPDSADVEQQEPCRTEEEDNCEYGTIKDSRDGSEYKTVVIGNQTWMAENMRLDYPGGANCIQDDKDSCDKYGFGYTWGAAMDSLGEYSDDAAGCGNDTYCTRVKDVRGICPEGWHLPDLADYQTLLYAVNEPKSGGSNLKAFELWLNEYGSIDRTFRDKYGFSLLPGGVVSSSAFNNQETGRYACLWTSYDVSPRFAYLLSASVNGRALMKKDEKIFGCYVRCVKD